MHFIILVLALTLTLSFDSAHAAGPDMGGGGGSSGNEDGSSRDLPRSRDLIDVPGITDPLEVPGQESVPVKPIPPRALPKGDSSDSFILKSILIEGAQTYKTRDLYPVFRFFIGKSVTIQTLNQIAARIERYYEQEGWLATKVILPAQNISGGNVRMRIFEGKVSNVILKGDAGLSRNLIKSALEDIKTGKPARRSDVEQAIGRLQTFSHFQLRPSLKASEDEVGGVDLVVEIVGHKPYSGLVQIHNTSSDTIGPWAALVSTNYHFAQTTISSYISTSFLRPEASFIGRASYEHQFDYLGSKLGAYVSGNRTRPENDEGEISSDDTGLNFGFYLYFAGYRSVNFNLETQLSYDWSRRLTLDGSGDINTEGDTNVITFGFSGNYRSLWGSYSTLAVRVRQGLTGGGGEDNGQSNLTSSGVENFSRRATWLTADFSHLQPLKIQNGLSPGLTLSLSGQMQYAFDPLTNSERVAFGKTNIGRGFVGGRISGDHGWGISTEVRASWAHIGIFNNRSIIQDLTLYGFFDHAQTFYRNREERGIDLEPSRTLRSLGLGVRVRWADKFYTDFNWARALNNPFQKDVILQFGFLRAGADRTDKGSDDYILRLYYLF